mmetsp:Transcript_32717/g.93972  ORF Transcript_32717/g.93972 Transcript_32717/m.93972 type:complete len:585 (+) Transcript_32717:98-1852(+)
MNLARISRGSNSSKDSVSVPDSQMFSLAEVSASASVRGSITIRDADLLRGTLASQVLLQRGRILDDCAGDDGTYNMSFKVRHIDVFISHNWVTPRKEKYRVLALCFNFMPAVGAALGLALCTTMLTAMGTLPLFPTRSASGQDQLFGAYALLLGPPAFLLVFFHWQEIGVHFPKAGTACRGTSCFLDKVCIHQSDEDRKQAGIRSLAAFLRYSHSMVVVYNDVYLQKLWTVYELASFLALQPGGELTVIPLFFPNLVWKGLLFYWIVNLIYIVVHLRPIQELLASTGLGSLASVLHALLALPAVYAFCTIFRVRMQEQQKIRTHVDNFSIFDAKCFAESDRAIVQSNIARFMRGIGSVGKDASEAEAMEAFGALVRAEVPKALQRSNGRVGMKYKFVLGIFLSQTLFALDNLAADLAMDLPLKRAMLGFANILTIHFGVLPLVVYLVSWLTHRTLHVRGHGPAAACEAAIALAACASGHLAVLGLESLRLRACEELAFLCLWAAVVLALLCLTWLSYRRRKSLKWRMFLKKQLSGEPVAAKATSRSEAPDASLPAEGDLSETQRSLPTAAVRSGADSEAAVSSA